MIWEQLPEGYYAVPGPDGMTYWRRVDTGNGGKSFGQWPTARPYPTLGQIEAAADVIAADPYAASVEFARFTTRCCKCSRVLTGPRSKVSAVGPECRKYVPASLIEKYLIPAVAVAHADVIATEQEELFQ